MIFGNYRSFQNNLIHFTIKLWLFLLITQLAEEFKICLGFKALSESIDNELVDSSTSDKELRNSDIKCEESSSAGGPNYLESNNVCCYFKLRKRLQCKGSIDYAYLKLIKDEEIVDFIVENYEAEYLYKGVYGSATNLETGEWYIKIPKLYQKLTGEIELKDTGLQINVNVRLLPREDLNGFYVDGEIFSNKVIKISWRLKGSLSLDFIGNRTVILLDVGAIEDSDWRLQSNLTFLKRSLELEADVWKVIGVVKSNYVSENQFAIYKGAVWTKMMKEKCEFLGEVKVKNVNLEVSLSGIVSPPQQKQITIPKSAFSDMTIKSITFKDSNFYNDFDKNSFQGLRGLKRIVFIRSKLETLPRLDELFQNFLELEDIYIEDCVAPRLKFGSLAVLKNVQTLSFKGSGPLSFDDTSFLWLRNSNLTFLSLRDSHVKISGKANSVLWSVKKTLKYLDISHSTLNEEKDLEQILNNLNIISLMAENLKLKKIPTKALSSVSKTLVHLSLRENYFSKSFEKHIFDSILNFPLMENLKELNLEKCRLNYIEKGTFDSLPNLKTLHLRYNNLENIQDGWSFVTPQITYLDLSHNSFITRISSMSLYNTGTSLNLAKFKNLEVLDLSNGTFANIIKLVSSLGSSLRNLSLRNTRLEDIPENFFENLTRLEILDLSYNRNIKSLQPFSFNLFKELKNLKSLNLKYCGIGGASVYNDLSESQTYDFILSNLQFLDLSVNNLKMLYPKMLRAFPNLKILNLSGNCITEWSAMTLLSEHLHTVFLHENKIETITNEMLSDIKVLRHVTLGNNPFVCGPYVYDVIRMINATATNAHLEHDDSFVSNSQGAGLTKGNHGIANDKNLKILDWSEKNYICFSSSKSKFIPFTEVDEEFRDSSLKKKGKVETTLLWLSVVIAVGVVISVAIICWKFLDIHLITRAVRNAVALSFISRDEKIPSNFKYNVFVSYSDKDRSWVVENLLPRLEARNDVKVCLHERDFQVGLSIIENILNCIDSSRNIILAVSEAFLKSQWCQYEMQLAQFRLLEKGRDHLILIFLENIPTVKRPKTLKYLMMTKTYLEWPLNPKTTKETDIFWNRLMRSLVNLN